MVTIGNVRANIFRNNFLRPLGVFQIEIKKHNPNTMDKNIITNKIFTPPL